MQVANFETVKYTRHLSVSKASFPAEYKGKEASVLAGKLLT